MGRTRKKVPKPLAQRQAAHRRWVAAALGWVDESCEGLDRELPGYCIMGNPYLSGLRGTGSEPECGDAVAAARFREPVQPVCEDARSRVVSRIGRSGKGRRRPGGGAQGLFLESELMPIDSPANSGIACLVQ
jgi:hypothetical protein